MPEDYITLFMSTGDRWEIDLERKAFRRLKKTDRGDPKWIRFLGIEWGLGAPLRVLASNGKRYTTSCLAIAMLPRGPILSSRVTRYPTQGLMF